MTKVIKRWESEDRMTGGILTDERLRDFLYVLLRDHVPMSVPEEILWDHVDDEESIYSNTYLIDYVDDLIKRLQDPYVPITDWPTMFKHRGQKVYLDGEGNEVEEFDIGG